MVDNNNNTDFKPFLTLHFDREGAIIHKFHFDDAVKPRDTTDVMRLIGSTTMILEVIKAVFIREVMKVGAQAEVQEQVLKAFKGTEH